MKAEVRTPEGNNKIIELEQTGIGEYQESFPINNTGIYLIHLITEEGNNTPVYTTGIEVPYSPEYRYSLTKSRVLERLVQETDGRVLNSPKTVFNKRNITFSQPINVWYYLVIMALIIFIIDLSIRLLSIQNFINMWDSLKNSWNSFKEQVRNLQD